MTSFYYENDKEDFERCIQLLREIKENYPAASFITKSLAKNYANAGKNMEAVTEYKEFLQKHPNDIESVYELFTLYKDNKSAEYVSDLPDYISETLKNIKISEISFSNILFSEKVLPSFLNKDLILDFRNGLTKQYPIELYDRVHEEIKKYNKFTMSDRFCLSFYNFMLSFMHLSNLDDLLAKVYLVGSYSVFPNMDALYASDILWDEEGNEKIGNQIYKQKVEDSSYINVIARVANSFVKKDYLDAITELDSNKRLYNEICISNDIHLKLLIKLRKYKEAENVSVDFAQCMEMTNSREYFIHEIAKDGDCATAINYFEEINGMSSLDKFQLVLLNDLKNCYESNNEKKKSIKIEQHIVRERVKRGDNLMNIFFFVIQYMIQKNDQSTLTDHTIIYLWQLQKGEYPSYAAIHFDIDQAKENLWRYLVEHAETAGYPTIDHFIVDTWMEWVDFDETEKLEGVTMIPRYDAN